MEAKVCNTKESMNSFAVPVYIFVVLLIPDVCRSTTMQATMSLECHLDICVSSSCHIPMVA